MTIAQTFQSVFILTASPNIIMFFFSDFPEILVIQKGHDRAIVLYFEANDSGSNRLHQRNPWGGCKCH